MEINSIWDKRLREFYIEIVKYFSIIGMSVFYFFIIFGGVFVYYYLKLLKWLPPYFPTEILAVLLITLVFLNTSVRTFVKKADIIYFMPMETKLLLYFKKSMAFSVFVSGIKLIIMLFIISPLIKHREIFNIAFFIIFIGLIILNIRLTWLEQWLNSKMEKFIHRLTRFLSFGIILYFLFIGVWEIAGGLMIVHLILWFYVLEKKTRGLNWEYLINQEAKSLLKIYKFINIFIDVPHIKHSFNQRNFLGWGIKKVITYKQSSPFVYLFAHLFVRYNEFFYLYLRLTLIGVGIIYFYPVSGWIINFPILFLSGYQLLPLQHSINDSSRLYPVSTKTLRKSFKKLLKTLMILQLILLNFASIIHNDHIEAVFMILIEMLFVYWFVYSFSRKRIFKQPI